MKFLLATPWASYRIKPNTFHRQVCLPGVVQEVRVVEGGEPGAGRPQVLRVHLAPAGRPPAERRHIHRKQKVPRRVARHEHGEQAAILGWNKSSKRQNAGFVGLVVNTTEQVHLFLSPSSLLTVQQARKLDGDVRSHPPTDPVFCVLLLSLRPK